MDEQPSQSSDRIVVRCGCGKAYRVRPQAIGRQARCACGRVFTIAAPLPKREARPKSIVPKATQAQIIKLCKLRPIRAGLLYTYILLPVLLPLMAVLRYHLHGRPPTGDACGMVLIMGFFHFYLLYQIWARIQIGIVRTTPWRAVVYHWVPIYNLYWVFQVYWGWAKDYNDIVSRHNLQGRQMPERLGLSVSTARAVLLPVHLALFILADPANPAVHPAWLSLWCVLDLGMHVLDCVFYFKARIGANWLISELRSNIGAEDLVKDGPDATAGASGVGIMSTAPTDQFASAATERPATRMATAAFALGISAIPATFLLCGPLLGLIAVIIGGVALVRANRRPGHFSGQGRAIGGIITGGIALILGPVVIMLAAGALWTYRSLQPSQSAAAPAQVPVVVQCESCSYVGPVPVSLGEEFPVVCPRCGERACMRLWECRACGHRFLLPRTAETLRCPECGSPKVGLTRVLDSP